MATSSNSLDFRDPGLMSDELLSVPGFINELKNYTIAENPANPVISAEGVYWAARFATHITQKMLFEAQFNVSEGAFDRLKQRFLNILIKHGGKLDHSTLLKSLRIEASLFKRIVLTLLMCDQIEAEELINGKRGYIIKNAA